MSTELHYDNTDKVEVIMGTSNQTGVPLAKTKPKDGIGCHAGADQMEVAARAAGKSDVLDQYAKDYPQGPHDKPQSMCPAFGSLRVGLRMRRVATILSGSACCVYGLTFTSHFYGGRRSVGYVPFNSETLKEIKSLNLNQLGCSYADATIIIDDEEKVSGNIMKSKIFKDSKTCSTVDLTKSEGDYSALLDEIERVIKSL